MISKEAGELMLRLGGVKKGEGNKFNHMKSISATIKDYDGKMKGVALKLKERIQNVQQQYRRIRQNDKIEQRALNKLSQLESSLKEMLGNYSQETKQANKRLQQAVSERLQEIKRQYNEGCILEKEYVRRYREINSRLQQMIERGKQRQAKMLQDYNTLMKTIKRNTEAFIQKNSLQIQEIEQRGQALMVMCSDLEAKIERKLSQVTARRASRHLEVNKVIHQLLESLTIE